MMLSRGSCKETTTMKKIILASAALVAFATSAFADPITFKDPNGITWTVTEGGNNADISKLYMSPDAAKACPTLRVKLETSKLGPAMDKAQKFRGDQRWHIVCDRSTPPATASAAPTQQQVAPPAQRQSAPPSAPRNPDTIEARFERL